MHTFFKWSKWKRSRWEEKRGGREGWGDERRIMGGERGKKRERKRRRVRRKEKNIEKEGGERRQEGGKGVRGAEERLSTGFLSLPWCGYWLICQLCHSVSLLRYLWCSQMALLVISRIETKPACVPSRLFVYNLSFKNYQVIPHTTKICLFLFFSPIAD